MGSNGGLTSSSGSRHGSEPFEIVFVCTGNRARSPLAEALFRRYTEGSGVIVHSVGTLDLGPVRALPAAVEAGRRIGVDLTAHRARPLRYGAHGAADLVVGFEPQHVSAAVIDGAVSASRVFLLGELVPLLDVPVAERDAHSRARSAVAMADSRRVRSRPDSAVAILDPLGKPPAVMQRTAAEIDSLVRQLALGLLGAAAATSDSIADFGTAASRG